MSSQSSRPNPPEGEFLLPFEAPLREVDERIEALSRKGTENALDEVVELSREREELRQQSYSHLSAWDRVCLARHPERPAAADYLEFMCDDHFELRGDRRFGDDLAMFAGLAVIDGRRVVLIANRKGVERDERIARHYGMPLPEGFRKALRAMRLAEKLRLPVVTLINTPGANPSVDAEDRGQAHAVAENLAAMAGLRTPLLSVVIGEGGCSGALAIGVADWIAMLENSYYCVVSPEGAAAVLWQDPDANAAAAEALKLTAAHLLEQGLIDCLIPEPFAGAHTDVAATIAAVKQALVTQLDALRDAPIDELLERRYQRYRRVGVMPAD